MSRPPAGLGPGEDLRLWQGYAETRGAPGEFQVCALPVPPLGVQATELDHPPFAEADGEQAIRSTSISSLSGAVSSMTTGASMPSPSVAMNNRRAANLDTIDGNCGRLGSKPRPSVSYLSGAGGKLEAP
eukprot:CAMPEP_0172922550 /NCGR_PEP_ID=MMETSP1075-20121228/208047_1 /TAXON_ID=2916 /ORGANISM="Ceratium fusus, Strain PA161109" /LENGTH=128 /DNA_ID=CAMNT_0013782883 /DNA_START=165 /DNA_END=550 /DNA_ORIENTATION=-